MLCARRGKSITEWRPLLLRCDNSRWLLSWVVVVVVAVAVGEEGEGGWEGWGTGRGGRGRGKWKRVGGVVGIGSGKRELGGVGGGYSIGEMYSISCMAVVILP